ncbi:pilus assembly protein [Methylobacillus gramineus]|uniref:TadE/TadG family type IV pilus assembly protein n=1 Tax=Methylobacillus gramineus TaxID=755169 RepID=UPI001CFF68FE|nr:TadE family protein [Methylobacillus gramineus]MCB5184481.1 pilus assembly protein [Methylobacillus gramineus]
MANLNLAHKRQQSGAAAIEFAMLFMLFFTLFYALVTYSIVFLLQSSFVFAASEGARSAIAVDPMAYSSSALYANNGVSSRVRSTVSSSLTWMPQRIRDHVLGINNSKVVVEVAGNAVTVRVMYLNYNTNPVIPILNIPGYGPMLPMPLNLQGNAWVSLV